MRLTERTRIKNHPERAVPNEAVEILSAGMVAHLGFVEDGQPYVIPLSYHYDAARPDCLYLHGSIRSRALELIADGDPVCVTVTLVDGLVFSRTAMNHSINYRSVVLLGKAKAVTDESEKFRLFEEGAKVLPRPDLGHRLQPPSNCRLRRDVSGRSANRGVERQSAPGWAYRAG